MLRRLFALACVLAACKAGPAMASCAGAPSALTPRTIAIARQRFDALVRSSECLAFAERAAFVNRSVNTLVDYTLDDAGPTGADLWLTPFETLTFGHGDCEDFAIAKYFLLLAGGAAPGEVRLLYARRHDRSTPDNAGRPHMVLLARHPFVDPLVFDNLTPEALPVSARHDLEPVFSFDRQRLWVGAGDRCHGTAERLRPWREVLARQAAQRA